MRIVDVVESPVKACCQFEFHGWTVSASTILKNVNVCAWNTENGDEIEGLTVQEVVDKIIIRAIQNDVTNSFVQRSN